MKKNSLEFKEMIYNLMNGMWEEELYPVKESEIVKNEFQEGELNDLSEELYRAKDRLYDKLGVDDDPDIERILECFERITQGLCYKMYDYGMYFATADA